MCRFLRNALTGCFDSKSAFVLPASDSGANCCCCCWGGCCTVVVVVVVVLDGTTTAGFEVWVAFALVVLLLLLVISGAELCVVDFSTGGVGIAFRATGAVVRASATTLAFSSDFAPSPRAGCTIVSG